ncbi:hypothetical protein [Actinomadura macra]|uniref:hypothetical protein n=1 Tax=Actinomadura macra TaxID=46164 RepID=UPI000836ED26|nr:hypothetical protein [Actinomadura macra]
MKLDALVKPPGEAGFGRRFFLVGYFPVYAATLWLLLLIWAGAWGPLRFKDAWKTASGLGLAQVVFLALGITLVAVVLHPLQLVLVRGLEGAAPQGPVRGWQLRLRWQHRSKKRLETAAVPTGSPPGAEEIQRAGAAGRQLRRRFPLPGHLVRATALGNVLAAMEDGVGRAYGLDVVTAWPRLYPLLGERVREIVDDRRDSLDMASRMAVTMAVTAVATIVLLAASGPWVLLAIVPSVLAGICYRGAVHAALAYTESVEVAVDLHRADLLSALRMKPPEKPADERTLNGRWSDHWRQGVPLPHDLRYVSIKNESYIVHKEQK